MAGRPRSNVMLNSSWALNTQQGNQRCEEGHPMIETNAIKAVRGKLQRSSRKVGTAPGGD